MTPPERLQDVTLAERLASVMDEMRASLEMPEDNGGWWEGAVSGWLADIEAAAALSVTGWQDIASAPKREVLLYWPPFKTSGRGYTLPAMMRVERAGMTPSRPPTHWHLLPTAPHPLPEPTQESR